MILHYAFRSKRILINGYRTEYFNLSHKDMYYLKRYLKDNDIFDSDKHQTTIRISCGKFGVDIKVSYREFYNKFELCKLALKNYKYEIEVI